MRPSGLHLSLAASMHRNPLDDMTPRPKRDERFDPPEDHELLPTYQRLLDARGTITGLREVHQNLEQQLALLKAAHRVATLPRFLRFLSSAYDNALPAESLCQTPLWQLQTQRQAILPKDSLTPWFIGLGEHPSVPIFLRAAGRVRNLQLSKDAILLKFTQFFNYLASVRVAVKPSTPQEIDAYNKWVAEQREEQIHNLQREIRQLKQSGGAGGPRGFGEASISRIASFRSTDGPRRLPNSLSGLGEEHESRRSPPNPDVLAPLASNSSGKDVPSQPVSPNQRTYSLPQRPPTPPPPVPHTVGEYFLEWLILQEPETALSMSYSLIAGLYAYSYEYRCQVFLQMIFSETSWELWWMCQQVLERFQSGMMLAAGPELRLTKHKALGLIERFFVVWEDAGIGALVAALHRDHLGDGINPVTLFASLNGEIATNSQPPPSTNQPSGAAPPNLTLAPSATHTTSTTSNQTARRDSAVTSAAATVPTTPAITATLPPLSLSFESNIVSTIREVLFQQWQLLLRDLENEILSHPAISSGYVTLHIFLQALDAVDPSRPETDAWRCCVDIFGSMATDAAEFADTQTPLLERYVHASTVALPLPEVVGRRLQRLVMLRYSRRSDALAKRAAQAVEQQQVKERVVARHMQQVQQQKQQQQRDAAAAP